MARDKVAPVLRRGCASGGKNLPKQKNPKRRAAMVLAAAAVDRGAAALKRKRKVRSDEEVVELEDAERGGRG